VNVYAFGIYLLALDRIKAKIHMNKLTFLLVIAFLCHACRKKPGIGKDPVLPFKMALVIGNPIDYGIKDLLLFPIGANYNPKIEAKQSQLASGDEDGKLKVSANALYNATSSGNLVLNDQTRWDDGAKQEYINPDEEDFDIRNILFYNKRSGNSYILSLDTLHVLSFAIHNEFKNPLIFYRVVKQDINKDSKYNSADAVMLYVSKLDGTGFIQVTPPDEQFFHYFYDPENQSILIKTAFDIDRDLKFTELDETNFREMRLSAPAMGREIFTTSLKDSLKSRLLDIK
jgi:hypothetical protein